MTPEYYQIVLWVLGLIALTLIVDCVLYFRRRRVQRRKALARLNAFFNEPYSALGNPDLPREDKSHGHRPE